MAQVGTGTPLLTNFALSIALPNFERDVVESLDFLRSDDRKLQYYPGHIVYCEEDESYYSFTGKKTEEYGYFQPLSLGGGSGISFEIPNDTEYGDFGYETTNPGEDEGEEGGEDTGGDGAEGGEENPDGGEDTEGGEGGESGEEGGGEGTEEPGTPEDEPTEEGTEEETI